MVRTENNPVDIDVNSVRCDSSNFSRDTIAGKEISGRESSSVSWSNYSDLDLLSEVRNISEADVGTIKF